MNYLSKILLFIIGCLLLSFNTACTSEDLNGTVWRGNISETVMSEWRFTETELIMTAAPNTIFEQVVVANYIYGSDGAFTIIDNSQMGNPAVYTIVEHNSSVFIIESDNLRIELVRVGD